MRSLRCALGIHKRYLPPSLGPHIPRQLWCRSCRARWRVVTRDIGGDVVHVTERLSDRPVLRCSCNVPDEVYDANGWKRWCGRCRAPVNH